MQAKIVNVNGYRKFEINGEIFGTTMFRSFCPSQKSISDAYNAGIKLMNIFPSGMISSINSPYSEFGEFWLGEGVYDFNVLRRQIDLFIENAPDTYLSILLQFDTRDWYLKDHPKATYSFTSITDMAGDLQWREAGKRMLKDVLDFLDREYNDRFYAIYIASGGTCEWLQRDNPDNTSVLKKEAFKRWKNDESAILCGSAQAAKASHGILRSDSEDKDALDFWRFNNEIIAEAICYFAAEAKKLRPNLLVGTFFGYFFYSPSNFLKRCHSAFSKVVQCPDIDMLFSPASYSFRLLSSVSASQLPIDSVSVNNKIYYHEIDNTTFAANDNLFAQVLQSYAHKRHSSVYETIQYMRREVALMMSKRQSFWWFDMFGGWYDNKELLNEIKNLDKAYAKLSEHEATSASEIAFIVDGASVAHYRAESAFHLEHVHLMREVAGRIGAPVDCYEVRDILSSDFNASQYKLYIFTNLIAPVADISEKIREIRKNGASAIFMHAAGAVKDGCLNYENIQSLCGINIKEDTECSPYIVFNNDLFCGKAPDICGLLQKCNTANTAPFLVADVSSASPIGYDLLRRDHIRAAIKKRSTAFDAWFASAPIPVEILRELAQTAGVFIYQENDLPIYANSRMLAVFAHKAGEYSINLPSHVNKLTGLFAEETYENISNNLKISFAENECKCFLIN